MGGDDDRRLYSLGLVSGEMIVPIKAVIVHGINLISCAGYSSSASVFASTTAWYNFQLIYQ